MAWSGEPLSPPKPTRPCLSHYFKGSRALFFRLCRHACSPTCPLAGPRQSDRCSLTCIYPIKSEVEMLYTWKGHSCFLIILLHVISLAIFVAYFCQVNIFLMDKPSAASEVLHEDVCLKQKWCEGKKKGNKFVIHLGLLHVRPAWLPLYSGKRRPHSWILNSALPCRIQQGQTIPSQRCHGNIPGLYWKFSPFLPFLRFFPFLPSCSSLPSSLPSVPPFLPFSLSLFSPLPSSLPSNV